MDQSNNANKNPPNVKTRKRSNTEPSGSELRDDQQSSNAPKRKYVRKGVRPESTAQTVPIVKGRLNCPHCDKAYSKKSNLNNHIESKHKHRRYICALCERPLSSKFAYDRHIRDRHNQAETLNAYQQQSYVLGSDTVATEKALLERVEFLQKSNAEKDITIARLEERLRDTDNDEA